MKLTGGYEELVRHGANHRSGAAAAAAAAAAVVVGAVGAVPERSRWQNSTGGWTLEITIPACLPSYLACLPPTPTLKVLLKPYCGILIPPKYIRRPPFTGVIYAIGLPLFSRSFNTHTLLTKKCSFREKRQVCYSEFCS